jgi:hypothetical protein
MKLFGAKDVESNGYNAGISTTNTSTDLPPIPGIISTSGISWMTQEHLHCGQQAIKDASTIFFKDLYAAKPISSLQEQVEVAQLFPNSVTQEDTILLDNPCTLTELQLALKSFALDKSPGPDGWTVEFYLHFFDLVGADLLELVEDSRLNGKITGAINSTFLTLIPKANHPTTFSTFVLFPSATSATSSFLKF